MSWYCLKCEEYFEHPDTIITDEDPGVGYMESDDICPCCGSIKITQTTKCQLCGKEGVEHYEYVCEECSKRIVEDFRKLVMRVADDYDTNMKDAFDIVCMVLDYDVFDVNKCDSVREEWSRCD